MRRRAEFVHLHQNCVRANIARVFTAEYTDSLMEYGAGFYRRLFWEAGLVGQVLYLEAEEAGIRSTGIGCYFDDPVHEAFGVSSRDWQRSYAGDWVTRLIRRRGEPAF